MTRNHTMHHGLDPQHMHDLLVQRFAEARIPLVWADSARAFGRQLLVENNNPVFMMDVRRARGRTRTREYVLVHFGNGTEVKVVDVDAKRQQVVLRVDEPESVVARMEWDERLGKRVRVSTTVPESTRSLLVGMDECHLFVCPLEHNASSVREAHRKLQPDGVRQMSHSGRKHVKRQGEWFFVPVDDARVLDQIAEIVNLAGPERGAPVGGARGARPHVVDERVLVGGAAYVRGRVRHPDHHVLTLHCWHAVHLNTESRTARIAGMTWVD
jgi:hypothetical protein